MEPDNHQYHTFEWEVEASFDWLSGEYTSKIDRLRRELDRYGGGGEYV